MLARDSRRGSARPTPAASARPGAGTAELANKFGRGSELGRKLFAIYNKNVDYTPGVAIQAAASATNPQAEHEAKQRQTRNAVAQRLHQYQHKLKKAQSEGSAPAINTVPARKPARAIEEECKEYQLDYTPIPLDQLVSSEQRKQLLQAKMSGLSVDSDNTGVPTRIKPRTVPALPSDDELINEIYREIADRQAFLDSMEALGKGSQHRATITAQIADLMHDLKAIEG